MMPHGTIHRLVCFTVLLMLATAASAQGTKSKAKTPDPPTAGEVLEVNDFNEMKVAKFIEMKANGAFFEMRLPDGSTKTFLAKDVRRPKNKVSAEKKYADAAGTDDMPAADPTAGSNGSAKKKRTWSDKSGKFKIEAAFVELAGGKVKLRKDDGSEMSVALDKLSEADQEIANLMASMKADSGGEENPFQSVEEGASASTAEKQGNPDRGEKITFSAPNSWKLEPDTNSQVPFEFATKQIVLPKREEFKQAFFEGVSSLQFNRAKGQLWAAVKDGAPGGKGEVRVEIVDAKTSKSMAVHKGLAGLKFSDFAPSGETLCTINDDDFFKNTERVDVWKCDGKLQRTLSLRPYVAKNGPWGIKIHKAVLVDDSQLLTVNDQGLLVSWKVPSGTAQWSAELGNPAFDISPNRQQLAVYKDKSCYILNAKSGDVLAALPTPQPPTGAVRVAYRGDGLQLAMLAGSQLVVWDLLKGNAVVEETQMNFPPGLGNSIAWGAEPNFLTVDNKWVIDLERRLMLCEYTGGDSPTVQGGQYFAVFSEFQQPSTKVHTIAHVPIPTSQVVQKVASVQEDSLLAIKPGTRVSVFFALPFDGPTHLKIREALFAKFTANGWTPVEDGGEAVLDIRVTNGKPYDVEYRLFGAGSQKVNVTPLSGSMDLKIGGKTIWQATAGWGPPFAISLQPGQTIAQATQVKASPEFFSSTPIPRRIFEYPKGNALLQAKVSPSGAVIQ